MTDPAPKPQSYLDRMFTGQCARYVAKEERRKEYLRKWNRKRMRQWYAAIGGGEIKRRRKKMRSREGTRTFGVTVSKEVAERIEALQEQRRALGAPATYRALMHEAIMLLLAKEQR